MELETAILLGKVQKTAAIIAMLALICMTCRPYESMPKWSADIIVVSFVTSLGAWLALTFFFIWA